MFVEDVKCFIVMYYLDLIVKVKFVFNVEDDDMVWVGLVQWVQDIVMIYMEEGCIYVVEEEIVFVFNYCQ